MCNVSLRVEIGVNEELPQVATGPKCYACQCENCCVKSIGEVKVTMKSFKVVHGHWVSFGLVR